MSTAKPPRAKARPRRDEHADATRRAIVDAARRAFLARGYAEVSVKAVAAKARVTTGALYHHFADKRALFEAVATEIFDGVIAAAAAAIATEHEPWARLRAGIRGVLGSSGLAEVRLVFIEAPTVLGLEAWRAIETPRTLAALGGVVAELQQAGTLEGVNLALLVPILRGTVVEAAMVVALADDPAAAAADVDTIIDRLLGGLRPVATAKGRRR